MININSILAALFCATAPIASVVVASPNAEVVKQEILLGKERVSLVRSSYENGAYNQFLIEMDAAYAGADIEGLAEMRQNQIPMQFQEEMEQKLMELQRQKGEDLLKVIKDKDDSVFAKRVRSASANLLSPEQEKGVSRLNSFISMKPGSGANADENALIDIDIEYEYKLLHGGLPTETSPDERLNQQMALRMEKMDKMVEASKNFQDHKLKQAVGIAADTLDARLARNIDRSDLNGLLKGKPANAQEEKVYSVLALYEGKFQDLLKEIDAKVQ